MYKKIFLTAEWRKLAFANYTIDPEILKPYLPAGTALDLWNGRCYVSLVGFMFLDTRLKGFHIPFHVNFEEVNLRFYVLREDEGELKRGVTFIKEIVSKPALTFIANTLYNEKYETHPMKHHWAATTDELKVSYEWKQKDNWNKFELTTSTVPVKMQQGSEEEFITEHYWGYSKVNDTLSTEYHLLHPSWKLYPVRNHHIDVDFGALYGREFSSLNNQEPSTVMLAEGSEVQIFQERRRLETRQ
jgi:uncharacterized protein YqjF (DUF2071 family)